MSVTNNYLKSSIGDVGNFLKNNTKPSEDMYANLLLELRVSNLLMPVIFDGENLSFPHIEVDDGTRLLPLFTSGDELKRYSTEFDYISLSGDMLDVRIRTAVEDVKAVIRIEFIEELNYPLMYVEEI